MEHSSTPTPSYPTNVVISPTMEKTPPPQQQQRTTMRQNIPQYKALLSGGFILLSAGMNLALSVGWFQRSLVGPMKSFCYSWFIGVIIGAVISLPLRRIFAMKHIMFATSAFIFFGGLAFTSHPYVNGVLLAARYLNGIGNGLSLVPVIMNASEISQDSCRGARVAFEQCCITVGIAIQMFYTSYWGINNIDFPPNRLHGILDILLAQFSVVCLKYVIESPIHHLRKNNEPAAVDSIERLQTPQLDTWEAYVALEPQKQYVFEQQNLTIAQSLGQGILPLLKMALFRSMMLALFNSLPLNLGFEYSMAAEAVRWVPAAAAIGRIFGSLIALIIVDNIGRLIRSKFPMSCIAVLFFIQTKLLCSSCDDWHFAIAKYFYIAIEFFVGFYTPYTSVYLVDAFPLRVKPFLMTICIITEQILQIVIICTTTANVAASLRIQGGCIFVAAIFFCLTLPETVHTSRSEAMQRFRKFWHITWK